MSRFQLYLFDLYFPSSGSYRRSFLSLFSVSSSLTPSSTSSLPPAVPTSSEPQDSQHSVDGVAVGASGLPGEVAVLATPEVTVAVAPGPSEGLTPASLKVALVVPSSLHPASPSPSLASGGPSFSDDVVQQFDATHRLSELTAAWGSLSTSFGEKLQVGFTAVPFLHARFSSVLTLYFSLSVLAQSFSRDHSGFFFSSENERKLSSEVSVLKADLDLLRAELETERQMHQKEEKTLRARVMESETAAESAKNECKGAVGSACILYFDFFFFADLFLGVLSSSPS